MRRLAAVALLALFSTVLTALIRVDALAQGHGVQPNQSGGGGGGGGSAVSVTPQGAYDTLTVLNSYDTTTVSFTVHNVGSSSDTYYLTMDCSGSETCISESQSQVSLGAGQYTAVSVTFVAGAPNSSGTVSLTAADGGGGNLNIMPGGSGPRDEGLDGLEMLATSYQSTGSYNIVSIPGPAPVVSLAPYSPDHQLAGDGVVYQHATPVVGSMGTQLSLALVYSSSAARPTPIVTVDVTNASAQLYPDWYQLQVQKVSDQTFLTLLNGSTSVYYVAAGGSSSTTRMVAAIDAKAAANNLTTGVYPVNVIVTALYSGLGSRSTSAPSRIMVNDQTQSAYGAGVALSGTPRLYTSSGLNGMLLVGGGGSLSYFDRACSNCSFVSPAGESGTLAVNSKGYVLTELDGSQFEFGTDGPLLDHVAAAGFQDATWTWTSGLLTSVTDYQSGRGFTLSYSGGLLTQITDFASRATTVSIVSGKLAAVIDPDGLADTLTYDSILRLTRVKNRAGDITAFGYNALNQLQSDTAPADTNYAGNSVHPTTTFTTAALVIWQPGTAGTSTSSPKGNVRPDTVMGTVIDPLGNLTRAAGDRFGLATKVVDAIGQTSTTTRDTLGNVISSRAPNGHAASSTYGGYLVTATYDSTTTERHVYTYTSSNRLQSDSGGSARFDYFYNDGSEGPPGTLQVQYVGDQNSPGSAPYGGDTVAHHYPDAFGRDTAVADGMHHRSHWVYAAPSAGGNLVQSLDAKLHLTTYHYNAYGLPDTVTDVNAGITSKSATHYDVMSRPDTTTDPNGNVTVYTYSPRGLTRIRNPNGNVYKFDLNAWGLTVARHDLADTTKADVLRYDAGGYLRSVNTRASQVITMTYDSLGRMLTRSGPDFPQETRRYGPNGTWSVAVNANAYDSVAFNTAGLPTSSTQRMFSDTTNYTMTYSYDLHGRPTGRSAPQGGTSVHWAYHATLGVLDTLCALGTCMRITRDAELNPVTFTYRPGQSGSWSHTQVLDSLHEVIRDTFSLSTLQADFGTTWWYDSLGRASEVLLRGTYRDFLYDRNGQIRSACRVQNPQCLDEYGQNSFAHDAYTYDPAGNRQDTLANVLIGAGNRLQRFKNYALYYDANGADTLKLGLGTNGRWVSNDTTFFKWNALGQLVRVQRDSCGDWRTDTLYYDALGRRVAKVGAALTARTWFIYDGDQIVLDVNVDNKSAVAEYAYSSPGDLFGVRTPTDTLVAIKTPGIHTVLGLVEANGGAEFKKYDVLGTPWSQQWGDSGMTFPLRFRMGGQEYDQEVGLYHLGARYYDPQLGRFLSEDPAGISGGLNLYAYAGNEPVSGSDPSGLGQQVPIVDIGSDAPPGGGGAGEAPCAADAFGDCFGSLDTGSVDAEVWAGFGAFNLLTIAEQQWSYDAYSGAAGQRIGGTDKLSAALRPMVIAEYEVAYNDLDAEMPAGIGERRFVMQDFFGDGRLLVDRQGTKTFFDPDNLHGHSRAALFEEPGIVIANKALLISSVPSWYVARTLVHEYAHLSGNGEAESRQCDIIRMLAPRSFGRGIPFSDRCSG